MKIDCLLIGHNQMAFSEYEQKVRLLGTNSCAYRDLGMNIIQRDDKKISFTEFFNESYTNHAPLTICESFNAAIAHIGTYLNKEGINFEFINSFQEEKPDLIHILQNYTILTIAIVTTLYTSVFPILEIIELIKKNNDKAKIVIGGPFMSTYIRNRGKNEDDFFLKKILKADYYINSFQGAQTLADLIKSLKTGSGVTNIDNLIYRSDNQIVYNPETNDIIPIQNDVVNWDLFKDRIKKVVNVRTTISCPFKCSFCGFPERAGEYQLLDIVLIEKQLKQLNALSQLKIVHFIDDTFNVPPKRFKDILKMMIKNRFQFQWHSYFRCQYADKEMVQLMKESGCAGVFLGIESGDNAILQNMNKSVKVEDYLRGIEFLKEQNITTFGNFIIGFPGETQTTVHNTINFIKNSGLDFYRCQLWYYEHITPIWNQREKFHITGESFEWKHDSMSSLEACSYLEDILISVEDPVYLPLYDFDFASLWFLICRGFSMEKIKEILKNFRNEVKENILRRKINLPINN